jgi:HAD superfamily hydrolase (TIGR01457 family)
MNMAPKIYRGILADLDGTVNRGKLLIPGADEVYRDLTGKGIHWVFVSNSATRLAEDLAERIGGLGLPVSADQVVNSAVALIHALRTERPRARIMVIGEPRLVEGVREAGATITAEPENTDIVTVAMDTGFTYDKLRRAHLALQNGALFWATNLDATFPVPHGFLPGAGSIVAAVATACGRPPDRVLGKPSPDMAHIALQILGLPAESCLVVGDRMETDILFARNAGIDSVLVLTGATTSEQLQDFSYAPTYVLNSIADLGSLFD